MTKHHTSHLHLGSTNSPSHAASHLHHSKTSRTNSSAATRLKSLATTTPMVNNHSNAPFNFIQVSFHNVGQQMSNQTKGLRGAPSVSNTARPPTKANIQEGNVFQMEYQQEDVKYGSKVPLYHWKLCNNPKRIYKRKEETRVANPKPAEVPPVPCSHLPNNVLNMNANNFISGGEEYSSCCSNSASSLKSSCQSSTSSSSSSNTPPVSPTSAIPRIPRTHIRIEDLLNPLN
ncbi:hypothetical protein C9374_000586 [Naegleria lovaniensis]|uniref:Uncharacterized protein n=1 Tax=Naegleria lovaniensis TaxID=51637 RepID=A0AA88KT49_NAELO|nr:uncharacterized protein C9374_000586 [Naegleria lovaniensis]KAG2388422.1 hypothetical protein C9374_000586 [Naegleria lovaniensis]